MNNIQDFLLNGCEHPENIYKHLEKLAYESKLGPFLLKNGIIYTNEFKIDFISAYQKVVQKNTQKESKYESACSYFNDVLIFFNDCNDINSLQDLKIEQIKKILFFIIYISLNFKIEVPFKISEQVRIYNAEMIIKLFVKNSDRFLQICSEQFRDRPTVTVLFYTSLVKSFMAIQLNDIADLTYAKIDEINSRKPFPVKDSWIQFLNWLKKIYSLSTGNNITKMLVRSDYSLMLNGCEQFPQIREGFIVYYCEVFRKGKQDKTSIYFANRYLCCAIKNFNNVEEFLSISDPKDIRLKNMDGFIVYLTLRYKISIPLSTLKHLKIHNAEKVVECLIKNSERFLQLCYEFVNEKSSVTTFFYPYLVKFLIISRVNDVNDLTRKCIIEVDKTSSFGNKELWIQFTNLLERILGVYLGKARTENRYISSVRYKNNISTLEKYKLEHPEIFLLVDKYIETEYIQKGIDHSHFMNNWRNFASWLTELNPKCTNFNLLTREIWLQFKTYILESSYMPSTKQGIILAISKLFLWLQENSLILNEIVRFDENSGITHDQVRSSTKPRMFENRELYRKIVSTALQYVPQNEKEELNRHLILITSATGYRVGEAVWLGPDCINEVSESGIGEVTLQILEKIGVKNKPMSCHPWGIDSIRILEERLANEHKIRFFNEKTKQYYQSLFQIDGKLLTPSYNIFKRILSSALTNDQIIDWLNGAKFHAFRHQKFNDIYEISGGNVAAVKQDSHHISCQMLETYTNQNRKQRQLEAYKAMEEGKIVGKSADILSKLLLTPYPPEDFIELYKKMSFDFNISVDKITKAVKYLGFGFCNANECVLSPICEGCDYFWSCKEFENELADRYAVNFVLVLSNLNKILNEYEPSYASLITGLKYQEKWLYTMGYDDERILSLRRKFGGGIINEKSTND